MGDKMGLAAVSRSGYGGKPFDESRLCRGIVTLRPSFPGPNRPGGPAAAKPGGVPASPACAMGITVLPRTVTDHGLMPTIALADDDRNILTSVSLALEGEGSRFMTYNAGASALGGFETSPPDPAAAHAQPPG